MQRVTLLTIGRVKEEWARMAAQDYLARLRRLLQLSVLELPPSRQPTGAGQAAEESERLLKSLEKLPGEVWVLDERGRGMTSQEFAHVLGERRDRGESVIVVLGGAYGLTDAIRDRATRILRLSDMTLPHELCRVLFLEQLYRACEIARGSGYHH